jgi:hypothetical protein
MEILIIGIALIALDIVALRYGADSRFGVDRDPLKLVLPRFMLTLGPFPGELTRTIAGSCSSG